MPDEPEQLGLVPDLIIDTRRRRHLGAGPGRPQGSKNRSTEAFGRLARGYTPDIVRRLCEIALNDDTILGIAAAKLILDRTWPKPRHIPISLDITKLPETRGTPDLQAIMTEVLNRTAAGDLAPETASLISSIVKDVARIADDPHTVAAQSEIAQTDDPREELARRWLRLFEAENGNGHHGEGAESGE